MAREEVPAPEPVIDVEQRGLNARISRSFTLIILFAIILVFTVWEQGSFFNLGNFNQMAIDSSQLLLLTIAVTFVIITAGIDLSISSMLVLSGVVAAKVMIALSGTPEQVARYEFPNQATGIPIGIIAGVIVGLLCGVVNGLLITRLKMPPFIVTLGTLGIYLGIAQLLTGGTTVPNVPPAVQQAGVQNLLPFKVLGADIRLTLPLIIAAIVAAIAAVLLRRTRFGRYTYAIGSNANAARRVGINVDAHLVKVYALCGFISGIAGIFDLLRFGTVSVGSHDNDNLAAISAAVIGGSSLFGGLGAIGGSVIGAFIPAVLRNGLVIGRVGSFWQNVAIGAVLILAVFIDQRRRAAEERV